MTVLKFSPDYLRSLVDEAQRSPRARQHRNIHTSFEDGCQRFMNAIVQDSYIRPHRHSMPPKAETQIAIRGRFSLITFDESGEIAEVVVFGTERYGLIAGVEIPPCIWHTIVALEPAGVLLELKAGPFDPKIAKELAPWSPEEQTKSAIAYLETLKAHLCNFS